MHFKRKSEVKYVQQNKKGIVGGTGGAYGLYDNAACGSCERDRKSEE